MIYFIKGNGGCQCHGWTVNQVTTVPPPHPWSNFLQHDNLHPECREILSSQPSEESWVGHPLYLYRGFWFMPFQLNGLLSCNRNFRARDDDVILASMPKSGTTWLKAILFSLCHRDMVPNPLLTTNPHDLVPFLELKLCSDNQNPEPELSSFTSPRILSTHIPYPLLPESIRDSKCKVVYLCRNLKDNFTSLWHFNNKFWPKEGGKNVLEEVFDKFCRGRSMFGSCWDHVLGYWKASLEMPEKVLFLKYEDMKENPIKILKRLAEFIGRPFDDDEQAKEILRMCSFESLSNLEVNKTGKLQDGGAENKVLFRKGEVGDWVNLLSSEMADKLDRITEEKLSGSGLKL